MSTNELIHSYTFEPAVFTALMAVARLRLEGKEHQSSRPKTAMRIPLAENRELIFRPQVQSSPTGWCVGQMIRVELRSICTDPRGKKAGANDVIVELLPCGAIEPRRWWRDEGRTREDFDVLSAALHKVATDPEAAISANSTHCALCGRGLTDPESKARGVGPECGKSWNALIETLTAKSLGSGPEVA